MAAAKINMRRRMTFILIMTLLCLAAVVVKLFIIQFVQGSFLQEQAKTYRTRSLTVSASRGTIYDAKGNKMAVSLTADSVGVYTSQVKASGREHEIAETLAGLLEMDFESVYQRITSSSSFVWIKRKVDFEVSNLIQYENLPGVTIVEETQRYYPFGTLAAHVLGFAGVDNQGLEGVELSLEDWLVGEDGSIVGLYDANEQAIPQTDYDYVAPVDGNDVYLTIDSNIQYFCERELAKLMASDTPPKRAGIIIMDPDTGAIVAMACSDPYDPNSWDDYESSSWRNWLVSDSYEPGSTFKTITLATALEEGTVTPSSSFYDSGSIRVANANIGCWASVPHGQQTLAEAVSNSCNPAFVQIAQSIENKQSGLFYSYIESFGFNALTGVDLPGEATGIIQAESNRGPVEIATTGIGQGIAVTPIQLITAVCAIANDGILLEPQIVSQVRDGEDVIYEMQTKEVRRVISAETAQTVRSMMEGVITDGSGKNAAIDGYRIAGKTGTAQKAENGVYASGKYVASFIGMVPAEDPELVCLVVVDEPSGVYYGSQVAAPIFKSVMSDTLRYLGIEPDSSIITEDGEDDDSILVQVPGVVNLDVDSAVALLAEMGLKAEINGEGPLVTSQSPLASYYVESGSMVVLYTGGITENQDGSSRVTVPNLVGKRLAATANLLSAMGLSLVPEGSGVAYDQNPAPGTVVESGSTVTVYFQDESTVINVVE